MIQEFTITGMTCQGCVAHVQSKLAENSLVKSATADLESSQLKLETHELLSVTTLQETLGTNSQYQISRKANPSAGALTDEKTWWATYKPLLLIVIFISGVSFLAAWDGDGLDLRTAMRFFMAGFFMVFSFFKFLDLKAFVNSYAMYDILAMRWRGYGWIYPFIELGLGIGYLLNWYPDYVNLATLIVMSFGSIGVIRSVLNKQTIQCACLGTVFQLPMSTVTIIEDLAMAAMAAFMLIF